MSAVADLIVQHLREAGTRAVFGVPGGGGNLDVIEAAGAAGVRFVLTSTETAGAIAALAYAEVTGRPGACLTTLGPGAASVVNGVAGAFLDRAPVIVFTDSNPVGARGTFAHQQLDHCALFAPITKLSRQLTPGRVRATLDEAFLQLRSTPPGPVHVDCPGDVTGVETESGTRFPGTESRTRSGPTESRTRFVRPLLLVGLGARRPDDAAAIRHLCETKQVPAMVTYKAKGVVPDSHPCFAGVFTNGAIERALVDQSDLLVGVGLDPVELLPRPWTFTPPVLGVGPWVAPRDHVPFDAQWITSVPAAMERFQAEWPVSEWDLAGVAATVRRHREAIDIPTPGLSAQRVVDIAARALAATHRVTVDAGAHMFPATMRWPVSRPNGLLISNGLSTMGFALPAAIGAAVASDQPVVALTGDGGLLMCAGELLTAVRERLRVLTIVFNDESLSLIEIKQQARRLRPGGVALGAVSWQALGESLGVASFAAGTDVELETALEQAMAVEGPSLIDVRVDRSNYRDMLRVIRG